MAIFSANLYQKKRTRAESLLNANISSSVVHIVALEVSILDFSKGDIKGRKGKWSETWVTLMYRYLQGKARLFF